MNRRGPSDATTAAVPLLEKEADHPGTWSAVYDSQMETRLKVLITPSSNCIVAPWRLDVDTRLASGGSLSYTSPQTFYILFNPWSLSDTVYMSG